MHGEHKESELLHDFIVTYCVFSFQSPGSVSVAQEKQNKHYAARQSIGI